MDKQNVINPLEIIVQKNEDGRMFMFKFREDISEAGLVRYISRRDGPFFKALLEDGHYDTKANSVIPVKISRRRMGIHSDGLYRVFVSYKKNGEYEPGETKH